MDLHLKIETFYILTLPHNNGIDELTVLNIFFAFCSFMDIRYPENEK